MTEVQKLPENGAIEIPDALKAAVTGWLRMDAAEPDQGGRRAIAKDADGAAIALVADRELAAYLALPEEQKEEVGRRLLAFWAHRSSPVREGMSEVAKKASTGRANAYRLIQRMSVLGPIRGLVPQYRVGQRASGTRDGFGEPIDKWIEEALSGSPSATIADVERHLNARRGDSGHPDIALPTPSALKRRIQQLRRSSPGRPALQPLGAHLLIDFCRVDVRIDHPPESDWWITAIVDVPSGIILGIALEPGNDPEGLGHALGDMRHRLLGAADHLPVADRIERVDWVVPPRLIKRADRAGSELGASRRPWIDILPGGERQFGVRLIGIVGDRLGDRRLLTRGRAARPSPATTSDLGHFVNSFEASFAIGAEVNVRNGARLASFSELRSRSSEAGERSVEALVQDMVVIFSSYIRDRN
ncbi:hypothetical protein [Sphingomonas sp. NFX23]|uniref:hypothetical protein n=1 Tax=Sphingomonas sp. NFX23 TaxID=2819532 RepID=UPI003CE7706D